MKIKDLDRNEVYDLTEIKKDSLKFYLLKEWLEKNCYKWTEYKSTRLHIWDSLKYNLTYEMWYMSNVEPTKCALTLFDLDITDYQVDCSDLIREQIKDMAEIVKNKGYTVQDIELSGCFKFFKYNCGIFMVGLDEGKTTITYDKFIELFGEKELTKEQLIESVSDSIKKESDNYLENLYDSDCTIDQGYKETQDKCNYELDFEFIRDLAMRIQNEPKYEPYNWQKPMDIEQLSNAMLRHAIEVKKGNLDDNGELGHLLAVAANAMFIYYQKKNN